MKKLLIQALGVTGIFVVCGCGSPTWTPPDATPSVIKKQPVDIPADAGVDLGKQRPANLWAQLVSSRSFSQRPDPFALEPKEKSFDVSQTTERIFAGDGCRVSFVPQADTDPPDETEPQPSRR